MVVLDLQQEIEREHSKAQTANIVSYVGNDKKRFDELMQLVFQGEYRISQRAAWPMGYVALQYPDLFVPYLEKAVAYLQYPDLHDAVARNVLRILQDISIPEELQGKLVDICLEFILEPTTATAIKAFSITVLQNVCREHADLIPEIKSVLLERVDYEKPAFQSRVRQFLKELK